MHGQAGSPRSLTPDFFLNRWGTTKVAIRNSKTFVPSALLQQRLPEAQGVPWNCLHEPREMLNAKEQKGET